MNYPIESSPLFSAIHDYHNKALKFKVLKFVEPGLPKPEGYDGRKWLFTYHNMHGFITPNWLVIYYNRREKVPLKDLEQTANLIVQGMINLAKEIAEKYNIVINPTPLPFSSNRPEIKTPYLSANNFIEKEAKAVYPPPSPIELTGENAVKNAWNLTSMIAELNESVKLFHDEIKSHTEATERWEAAAQEIINANKPKPSIFQRIQNYLNLLIH
jgi:hypothetical protein